MIEFKKYVKVNDSDILLAIREGLRPIQFFYDKEHGNLPYFGNVMAGGDYFGNKLHTSYSLSHIPGRWLNALLNAEDVLGKEIDESIVDILKNWAYASVEESGIGLPACIDLDTLTITKQYDLHNLREAMHAYYALVKYRNDERALTLAETVIDTVEEYYDYERGYFKRDEFYKDTGGTLVEPIQKNYPFPVSFGRYIGPLVKLYNACGNEKALKQAIKLKDTCFKYILDQRGTYDPKKFGYHTHSTTAMISSLAQLGETLGDTGIIRRVKAFIENGLNLIAVDFGWCIERYDRNDLTGEINNTSDIMESYIILANAGFKSYYSCAEQILRAHFLPSQMLDTHFIPQMMNPDDGKTFMIHEFSKGAFGFPSPYGHEYEIGSKISFNWDIVGGAIGGLCEAYRNIIEEKENMLSINMLFDYSCASINIISPYENSGVLEIYLKKPKNYIQVRLDESFEVNNVKVEGCDSVISEGYLYLLSPDINKKILITLPMKEVLKEYRFREHSFKMFFKGQKVIGAQSSGKRLCYFEEIFKNG